MFFVLLVFPMLYPSYLLRRKDSGFTANTNNIRLRVSPCSIPRSYFIKSVSMFSFSPFNLAWVLHLSIS